MSSTAPGEAGVFTGEAGQTRSVTFNVWCPGCGAWYGAQAWATVNRATDERLARRLMAKGLEGINTAACPSCERPYVITTPVLLHDPDARLMVAVLDEGDRHQARERLSALTASLQPAPGSIIPPYALQPALVIGGAGLSALLDGEAPSALVLAPAQRRPMAAPLFEEDDLSVREGGAWPDLPSEDTSIRQMPTAEPPLKTAFHSEPAILDFPSSDGSDEDLDEGPQADRSVVAALPSIDDDDDITDMHASTRRRRGPEMPAALSEVLSEVPAEIAEPEGLIDADERALPPDLSAEDSLEAELRQRAAISAEAPLVVDAAEIGAVVVEAPALEIEGEPEAIVSEGAALKIEGEAATEIASLEEAPVSAPTQVTPLPDALQDEPAPEDEPAPSTPAGGEVAEAAEPGAGITESNPAVEPVDEAPADAEGASGSESGEPQIAEPQSAEPPSEEAEISEAEDALSVELSIADVEDAPEPASEPGAEPEREETTHVVSSEEISGARRAPRRIFLEEIADGADRYVAVDEERVVAAIKLDSRLAEAYELEPAILLFQLHQVSTGPVMSLALARDEGGEWAEPLVWILAHERAEHTEVLNRLRNHFEVEILFYGQDDVLLGHRRFRLPLEMNVADAWSVTMESEASLGRRLDRAAARAEVAAPEFDRFGRLRHNFHEHSFSDLITASQARLALGILTYWSGQQRQSHLLRIRAFPQVWFDGITRRVLSAALSFGLAMEPHMRQRALDLDLASDPEALVRVALANFAEVNLNLKPNDLDPLDLWNNWEALLASAEELEIRVDEELEELAALSMEKARSAAMLEEEGEELDASVHIEEPTDLSELSAADLVGLLEDNRHRLDAALALFRRGDAVYVPTLFDAILKMSREEQLKAVPAALAMGPAFEASFLTGLRSRRGSVRLASALFLAEIRSDRAAQELLALLSTVDEAQWPVVARAAARIGRRIIEPALAVVRRAGDPGGRVAHALALLGPEARGALAAALDKAETPAIAACLERALDQAGRISLGDAADFGERLADAFDTLGPDGVGPDYEEDVASIDLSGASLDIIEIK